MLDELKKKYFTKTKIFSTEEFQEILTDCEEIFEEKWKNFHELEIFFKDKLKKTFRNF